MNDYPAHLAAMWQKHLAPRKPDAPTVISTFAGAGGSSLGYSMAGFRELLAVEWDNNAVETFQLNFPGVPVYHGDIAKLSVDECLSMAGIASGELDVFDGSPPCQGFSTAGKRQIDDPRNQLFREYVRLLRGLRPKVFVMENVSGMVKGKMRLVFVEILKELKASGYQVSAKLLNAMWFNVPQSRARMIFIGVRDDLGIDPSHPKGEGRPVTAGDALDDGCIDLSYSTTLQSAWHKTPLAQSVSNGQADFKLHPARPLFTIRGAGAFWHWALPYPLNTRGYARGASFPDDFKWAGTKVEHHKRIGNSVPPLFMEAIARHIRREILDRAEA